MVVYVVIFFEGLIEVVYVVVMWFVGILILGIFEVFYDFLIGVIEYDVLMDDLVGWRWGEWNRI